VHEIIELKYHKSKDLRLFESFRKLRNTGLLEIHVITLE